MDEISSSFRPESEKNTKSLNYIKMKKTLQSFYFKFLKYIFINSNKIKLYFLTIHLKVVFEKLDEFIINIVISMFQIVSILNLSSNLSKENKFIKNNCLFLKTFLHLVTY